MTTKDEKRDEYNKRAKSKIDEMWDTYSRDPSRRDKIEYYIGREFTNWIWKEDQDGLKKDVDLYSNTKALLGDCWKAYKNSIDHMSTPDFWECPDKMVMQAAEEKKLVDLREGSEDVLWICYVEDSIGDKSISYNTILTLLIGYGAIYQRLWAGKWCRKITGVDPTARMPVFAE